MFKLFALTLQFKALPMEIGIIALWNIGHGLIFWAIGFGVMHIIYGVYMWIKYERK